MFTMEALLVQEKMGKLLPCCSVCGQVPSQGIHGGIKLKNFFLCRECEWAILTAEVGSPDYEMLMDKLRNIARV